MTVMTVSLYTQLRRQIEFRVCASPAHLNVLAHLKECFKKEINSPRKYEAIDSIGKLLSVLEVRDVLSEDNVEPLKNIAQRLAESPTLMRKITEYENSHVPRNFNNSYYDTQNNTQNLPNAQGPSVISINAYGNNMTSEKKERMCERIQEEIGNFWKDLARNLKIRECKIDEIDGQYRSVNDKTSEILKVYERKCDPQRWFLHLCEGLEKSRRTDLSKALQEIMTMNI